MRDGDGAAITILGTPVGAEGDEVRHDTAYRPTDRSMPFVEVKVEWGGGPRRWWPRDAGALEPGMAMIRGPGRRSVRHRSRVHGAHRRGFVNLTVAGVDDHVAVAKRIITVSDREWSVRAGADTRGQGDRRRRRISERQQRR